MDEFDAEEIYESLDMEEPNSTTKAAASVAAASIGDDVPEHAVAANFNDASARVHHIAGSANDIKLAGPSTSAEPHVPVATGGHYKWIPDIPKGVVEHLPDTSTTRGQVAAGGIGFGGLLFLLAIIGGSVYCCCRKKRARPYKPVQDDTEEAFFGKSDEYDAGMRTGSREAPYDQATELHEIRKSN